MITSSDYHQSEYVGEHFKSRAYISEFTGSAGTGIDLYKMGEEGVPTVNQFIEENIGKGGTLAFDGRTISAKLGEELEHIAVKNGGMIEYEIDLVDKVWVDRPSLSTKKAYILEEKYTGQSTESKLEILRAKIKELGAKHHIVTTLDDEAWILNIRGNNAPKSPLILCYMIIHMDKVELFIDETKLNDEIKIKFAKDNIEIKPYNDIYMAVKDIDGKVLLDKNAVNYGIVKELPECVDIIQGENPSTLFKVFEK